MAAKRKTENDWQKIWDARVKGLTCVLGKPESKVFHAFFPFEVGGFADVLTFPGFVRGKTYVTVDCTSPATSQLHTRLGNYELMICTEKGKRAKKGPRKKGLNRSEDRKSNQTAETR